MSSMESDGTTNQFDSPDIVPEREFNQNCILTITELMYTVDTEWDNSHVLDERQRETDS